MDLAYSARHEEFRSEVREFLQQTQEQWPPPRHLGRASAEYMRWQALLIERGHAARSIPSGYGSYGGAADILKSHYHC